MGTPGACRAAGCWRAVVACCKALPIAQPDAHLRPLQGPGVLCRMHTDALAVAVARTCSHAANSCPSCSPSRTARTTPRTRHPQKNSDTDGYPPGTLSRAMVCMRRCFYDE